MVADHIYWLWDLVYASYCYEILSFKAKIKQIKFFFPWFKIFS